MELFEQRDSLEVLNGIYEEFESGQRIVDELVKPITLSVLDGIVSHKQLKLDRTGLSASRIWEEVQSFDYNKPGHRSADTAFSQKQQLEAMRAPRKYDEDVRNTMTKQKSLEANKDAHFKNNQQSHSSVEFNKDGSRVTVYRKQKVATEKGHFWKASDTDHVIPVKQINDRYANNAFLSVDDIQGITDSGDNLIEISNRLNRAKGDRNFSEMYAEKCQLQAKKDSGQKLTKPEKEKLGRLSKHTDKTYKAAIEKENQARESIEKQAQETALKNLTKQPGQIANKAGKQAAEQTGYQAIGHAIILFIKPLFYEMNDAIRNGFAQGVNQSSIIDGIKYRFKRLMAYVKQEIIPTCAQAVKDLLQNFFKILIQGVLDLVTGMFKKVIRIISEGFSALVGAVKILGKKESEMSRAQKADAIAKLFAATAVTFTMFTFESLVLGVLPETPAVLKDIALATLSGVASSLVVYLLDKADLFSVKAELRSKRVAEVFDLRIEQIKLNTDAFQAESIRKLAEDRLRFKAINDDIMTAIDDKKDVNPAIYALADHFKIKLDIRDTDDFLKLLKNTDALVI
ncbi:hypothetical protein [Parendozoicomonas haliclonae]|nr:hypothetical protein [Parendozoicomonas haliclonae]